MVKVYFIKSKRKNMVGNINVDSSVESLNLRWSQSCGNHQRKYPDLKHLFRFPLL
jgi:hypothetical protein